ncbi:hypothetical protein IDG99_01435 [Pelagibacterales bacterium SAG-MED09]|nr:hypothetical protein [Pelagibacterales bacterium SAG-MED09]
MKFKTIFFLIFLTLLNGCDQLIKSKPSKLNLKPEKKYKNIGFALIYNEDLKLKNLDHRSLQIFHKTLKAKSQVKISNPLNNKSLIAEIKSNKVNFSNFYNSIITNRILETLEINPSEPYIEIVLISNDSTFIANKAKTFDEEREVAQKAPIDGIQINDLNNKSKKEIKKKLDKKFSYSIKVADFYYQNTAKLMIDRIKMETSINNAKLIKLSETNYRVLLGPFNDIKSLKDSFEKMNSLNFENLEILKNV